ncbi:MAG: hypothetical protein R3Y60_03275 [bacterium]
MFSRDIYSLVCNNDFISALLLLDKDDLCIATSYNKAYCFYKTNSFVECMNEIKKVVNKINDKLDLKSYELDKKTLELISNLVSPMPLHCEVVECNALYASIHIKWLYALCLEKCNITDKANLIKEQLKKYNINFGGK